MRKVLRVFTFQEISKTFPGSSFISINTFKDALSLGAFKRASITIKSVSADKVYPLYGEEHTTTLAISSCAIISEISNFFKKTQLKLAQISSLIKQLLEVLN